MGITGNGDTKQNVGGPANPRPYCPACRGGPYWNVLVMGVHINAPPLGALTLTQILPPIHGITEVNCPPHENASVFCGVITNNAKDTIPAKRAVISTFLNLLIFV